MRRREFVTLLSGVALTSSRAVRAQQSERLRSVGVLFGTANDMEGLARASLLRQGLSELGWTEGRNIHVDYRWIGGDADRANGLRR
jgi:putative ABC transport system substrate-binding protein